MTSCRIAFKNFKIAVESNKNISKYDFAKVVCSYFVQLKNMKKFCKKIFQEIKNILTSEKLKIFQEIMKIQHEVDCPNKAFELYK